MLRDSRRFAGPIVVGHWRVEPDRLRLSANGRSVALQPRVMDTLVYLVSRPGEVVSAAELRAEVWVGRVVEEAAVYQTVAKLRRALEDDPHAPRFIETIPKKGYRLIATVGAADERGRPARYPLSGLLFAGLTVGLLAGVALYTWNAAPTRVTQPSDQPMSIAVLPFVDMSADRSLAYLGDGIAEELIHRLSGRDKLRVIARTSSFALRGPALDVRRIGERLGVDTVLEGSVRRSADRLWVTAQLIDVDEGFHVWSEKYERPLGDVFSIQADIADRVARSIMAPGTTAEPRPSYTPEPLAYERYLLGRHQVQLRRVDSLRRGIDYLREAVAIDPGFAAGQAALANALFLASEHRYGDLDNATAMEEAGQVANAALAIDPDCVACLVTTSRLHTLAGRLDEAESDARRALRLRPAESDALAQLGDVLDAQGRPLEAIAAYEQALERDPVSARRQVRLAALNALNDRPGPAERHYRLAVEIDPNWHVAWYGGAMFLRYAGRLPEALRWAHRAATIEAPDERFVTRAMWLMGELWFDIGEPTLADEWLRLAAHHAEPATRWRVLDARIRVAMSQGRDEQAHELTTELYGWGNQAAAPELLAALYEALMGHEAHALALYDRAAAAPPLPHLDDARGNLHTTIFLNRGYLPALTNDLLRAEGRSIMSSLYPSIDASKSGAGAIYLRAIVSHLQGDDAAALDLLRAAIDDGWLQAWYLRRDPLLRALQEDARFADLIRLIEVRQATLRAELRRKPGYEALAFVGRTAAGGS